MGNVNVFESMRKVTSRIEPFHTQFLADMLQDSLQHDRSLFEEFWALAAPQGWDVPKHAEAKAEVDLGKLDEKTHVGKIDLCIYASAPSRVLGVEIKTTDSSVTEGQLRRYHKGLERCYADHEIAVSYLTPFNAERAGELADQLPTVKEYNEFVGCFPTARHVSWLEVAEIGWDYSNQLWQQHRVFVLKCISSHRKLKDRSQRDRAFNEFFGDVAADKFWEDMHQLGFTPSPGAGAEVCLSKVNDIPAFVRAFATLIEQGEEIARGSNRGEKESPFKDPCNYRTSEFGAVHEALFELAGRFDFVWIQGEKNYGIRVAHSSHPSSGVSIVRSLDVGRLLVGQPR